MLTVTRQQPILLVEDSPEDCEAIWRALGKAGVQNPLIHCVDGDDALDFLYHRGVYAYRSQTLPPGLILLDLHLPGTDGYEVLAQIKQDADLCTIPVVVLTTSCAGRDIEACYAVGANSYITKPVHAAGFRQAIQRLTDYWFEVVTLPQEERTP